ncbi:MAG: hypothetical protein GTN78_01615, partial [Gemmatimonadales bacterium]|nr:hypothetical protein [Gemmatimonadales bacterium]
SPESPQFDAGVFNGTGINTDDDNKRKSVMARINWPVKWPARDAEVAVSGYMGTDGEGAQATDQDRYGVGARFRWPDGTQFAGEYAFGRDLGASVRGWYAQLGRPISRKRPNLLFIKYDWYDENT